MAQKKKNLAAALADTEAEPQAAAAPAPVIAGEPRKPLTKRSDRAGMVNIAAWFPMAVKFELEALRLDQSRERGRKVTMQEIMAEALNDLFKKHGRPELAPTKDA